MQLNSLNKWIDDVPLLISKHENFLDLNNLEDPFMKKIVQEIQTNEKSVNNAITVIQELEEKGGHILKFSDLQQLKGKLIHLLNHILK